MDLQNIISKPTLFLMLDFEKEHLQRHFAFSKKHQERAKKELSKDFNIVEDPASAYIRLIDRVAYTESKIKKTNSGSITILREIIPFSWSYQIESAGFLEDDIKGLTARYELELIKAKKEYDLIIRKNLRSDADLILDMTCLNEEAIIKNYINLIYGIKRGDLMLTGENNKSKQIPQNIRQRENTYSLTGYVESISDAIFDWKDIITDGVEENMSKIFVKDQYRWETWKKRMETSFDGKF